MTIQRLTRRNLGCSRWRGRGRHASVSRTGCRDQLVAATFPGNWEDAYRKVLTPLVGRGRIRSVVAPALAQDQLAKVMASPGKSPLRHPADVARARWPSPSRTISSRRSIPSTLNNWSKLDPAFQGEYGPTVTVEVNGIAYNPDLVPRAEGLPRPVREPGLCRQGVLDWIRFEHRRHGLYPARQDLRLGSGRHGCRLQAVQGPSGESREASSTAPTTR